MHGSEANEHVFGLLRSLITDFTMLDVLYIIPKLNVRLMAACRAKHIKVDFRRTAVGYSHTYFDACDVPLGILAEFPSDQDIARVAGLALDEANALWDLLGYYHSSSSTSSSPCDLGPSVHEDKDIGDDLDHANDTTDEDSDRRALREALESSRQLSSLDEHAQTSLNQFMYAAACLDVAERERM
jgi:hypothetical protein